MSLTDSIRQSAQQSSQLLSELSASYNDFTTFNQARNHAASLNQQIPPLSKQVTLLTSRTEKEKEEWEELHDSNVRQKFSKWTGRSDKFEAKTEKEEKEYREAEQKENDAKGKLAQMQQQLKEAEDAMNSSKAGSERHLKLQAELDDLYNSIFSARTPDFPEQDQARAAFASATTEHKNQEEVLQKEQRAVKLLEDAHRSYSQAQSQLNSAQSASDFDMLGGGAMTSMMKRDSMNSAHFSIQTAHNSIQQAQQLVASVREAEHLDVSAQGSGATDVFFDNIFTDMRVADEISNSSQNLARAVQVNMQQIQEGHGRIQRQQQAVNRAAEARDAARWELQRVRADIFQRVAGG